jgi:DNA-binding response OmpR family regulator
MNKQKILIVEDEESLSSVLKTKLKKEGYDTQTANNGQDGYNKLTNWRPDLVLLDIVLPKMDGYEYLEKMNEEKNKTPVIVISNSGQPIEIEKIKKLGAVDYLIKTQFDPDEVITKVNNYLDASTNSKGTRNKENHISQEIKPREDQADVKKLGIKVLLVEDDHFLRDICAKKLIKEGFTVFEVIDGEQALKEVGKIKPDIVLLDIILPAIDGFEVLSEIRSNKDKKISQIPIVMLSNLGQEDDIKKAVDLGADSYLVKAHFTTEEIVKKIKEVLAQKKK